MLMVYTVRDLKVKNMFFFRLHLVVVMLYELCRKVYLLDLTQHFTVDSDHILYDIVGVARGRYSDILLARCRVRRAGNNGKLQPLQKQRLQVGTDLLHSRIYLRVYENLS